MIGKLSDSLNWWISLLAVLVIVVSALGVGFFLALNLSAIFIHVPAEWHGYQGNQVMADYQRIIKYLQWWPSSLRFHELPSSAHAMQHFADVKLLVERIQCLTVVCLLVALVGSWYEKKNYQLWRLVILFPRILVLLIVIVGMLCLSFNDSFILMHQLLFHNHYWIFSSKTDPVILLLPVSFFIKVFVMWIAFALTILLSCWYLLVRKLN